MVTVSSWGVTAWSAPSTLKRWRPLGARKKTRVTLQRKPRNGAGTKCDASMKKTTRLPATASRSRGASASF